MFNFCFVIYASSILLYPLSSRVMPAETSRQLATVIAALRIRTTRPPGWLRVTIDNMEK